MKVEKKKRKVGRPRMVEGVLQDQNIHFMIDIDRYCLIENASIKLGVPLSEFCKDCITDYAKKILGNKSIRM
jgi:hypothetical protein